MVPGERQRVSVELYVQKTSGNRNGGHVRLAFTSAFAPRRRTTVVVGGLCARVRAFTRVFFLATREEKGRTELTGEKCGNTPGDPASLLLNQREEFSKDCF